MASTPFIGGLLRSSAAAAVAVAAAARAAVVAAGGGELGAPGGGTTGGVGIWVSGCTQAERSKNRNSSAFSCADSVLPRQPSGNSIVGLGDVRLVARRRRRRVEVDGGEDRAPALRVGAPPRPAC